MNIKGILRSTAAKIIAFAGIVGCFAAAVLFGENAIAGCGRDGMIYQFETDFSQSSYMAGQVNNTAVTLEAALEAVPWPRKGRGTWGPRLCSPIMKKVMDKTDF